MIYSDIQPEVKAPALAVLVGALSGTDLTDWRGNRIVRIGLQNLLRSRGLDEAYFQVPSLDDIFIPLVEEAILVRQAIRQA